MYRFEFHLQVQMGRWRDFGALVDELNAALAERGLVPFQLWELAVGRLNDALMVADYESLAAYEREHDAMHADPPCMGLWRRLTALTGGAPWTDLWWRPRGA